MLVLEILTYEQYAAASYTFACLKLALLSNFYKQ